MALREAQAAFGQSAAAQAIFTEARTRDTGNDNMLVTAARLAVQSGRTDHALW